LKNIRMRNKMNVEVYKTFALLSIISVLGCSPQLVKTQINIDEQIKNVMIQGPQPRYGPCEPTIAISPLDQNFIVAGSVLDNLYISKDGGHTWSNSRMTSTFGVYGDPVVKIDGTGKIYYAHLSNPASKAYASEEYLDRIVVQTSSNDGKEFDNGNSPLGDRLKDQDKHWLAINPKDNTVLMSWTEFDKYGAKSDTFKSRIMFSSSSNQGKSWTEAKAISEFEGGCLDDDNTTEGAVPALDLEGNYYVVWSYDQKIFLDISNDRGKTWLTNDQIIADQPGGWTFDIPGLDRSNGLPTIRVDMSNGPNKGQIYVSWADQRNGTEDTDIWLIKSKDKGMTWTKPIRVNDDSKGKHQFLPAMDIDQSNGNLYWVFYDRRNHQDMATDVYLAFSNDGGNTIRNRKISTNSFTPSANQFFGDYNDISAVNGKIRPIWTIMNDSKSSIYTAIIDVK
jgi:hypothetical protein